MPQIHGAMLIVYIGGLDRDLSDRSRDTFIFHIDVESNLKP